MSERGERSPWQERGRALVPLLDHLASAMPVAATRRRGWRITPIPGRANNRLCRWAWLVEAYRSRRPDPGLATRVGTYTRLMLVWWVVRFARLLCETPRGLDPLATRQAATRA